MKRSTAYFLVVMLLGTLMSCSVQDQIESTVQSEDARMEWWREARFGMFIHWGLYAIPAGEWNGQTNHAEWIRTTAEIPLDTYDEFLPEFNPVKFDADAWVSMAKEAGMKYITITSKHHDGFALYDSKVSDYDVMSTPFQRDILKELAEACRKADIKLCFYHSIMDWHHPDYLPRRNWEKERSAEGAEFPRFVDYMKSQLKELLTEYGDIGVLWFDGEWEDTWTHEDGVELYDYVRSFQSDIIINNRVDKGRQGMQGLTAEGDFKGDFGTPEQEIPDMGLPGIDWESCMTMNDHWGYNKNDDNWKSAKDLIQKLSDIASKGGNFLLNIGPKADGTFPQESIDRLKAIGSWMKVNSGSIYGTSASPFEHLSWGRVTQKALPSGTRLYLHVFDWPTDGKLRLSGIRNNGLRAGLLSSPSTMLEIERDNDALVITVPETSPDPINAVVFVDIEGTPEVVLPPQIIFEEEHFVDEISVELRHDKDLTIRYTLDGSLPTLESPAYSEKLSIDRSVTINARLFENSLALSGVSGQQLTKVEMQKSSSPRNLKQGLAYRYYEGDWNQLPNFKTLKTKKQGTLPDFDFSPRIEDEHFGFEYNGYINIPENGAYRFYTSSDDGSQLFINDQLVVDNDGLHGMVEENGLTALSKGYHKIRVTFFEKSGGDGLIVSWKGPNIPKNEVPSEVLFKQ
ncbi:alpha-L-fucosidase [Roseivirga sp. E12]|uniref:alpha-L-fucosidase n=1 Tax=Roseivirga sp. E12 TaxID=2819237 RepID=UPI001ABC9C90|nr:alpha-L-fucosidase [Roseivirga sp. E12]